MAIKKYPYQNLSLEDMKGEVWEDIPGFADYYQVSNCGRVKSLERRIERNSIKGDLLLKERIMKQTVRKHFNPYTKKYNTQLGFTIMKNREKASFSTGRIVYYLFVKKFDTEDHTLVIVPADNDYLNMHCKNLNLIKKGEVQRKTYRENRKKKLFKAISQYDTSGNIIKTYASIIEAESETGYSNNTISQAAHGHISHCGGWLWKFSRHRKIKAVKFPYGHVKRVTQYDRNGRVVKHFFSISEAERLTGFDDMGIRDCAKGKRASYKGFVWKYRD